MHDAIETLKAENIADSNDSHAQCERFSRYSSIWCKGDDSQRIIGGTEMSALNLRLPDSIHRHIREVAKKEGVSD